MCMDPGAMDTHVSYVYVCASALHLHMLLHEMDQTRFDLV